MATGEFVSMTAVDVTTLHLHGAVDRAFSGPTSVDHLLPLRLVELSEDSSVKYLALGPDRKPLAFVAISPADYPQAVADGWRVTADIKRKLSQKTGSVILDQLADGEIDGRTYSVTPYRPSISSWRPLRFVQRVALTKRVWRWLHQVAAETQHVANDAELEPRVARPLRRLIKDAAVAEQVRTRAEQAYAALLAGTWRPRLSVCHADIWEGNVLRAYGGTPFGMHVIDWGGAQVDGHAIYDWIRLGKPRGISKSRYRGELAQV
ncbi:MAG: hypothetical protein RL398_1482, partial [Planctomycetota bacterium]